MQDINKTVTPLILQGEKEALPKKERSSNLELFRIIVMLLIIAHHYVVNSGLTDPGGPVFACPFSCKSIFLLLFGMWGKTGINCFVLITGYFMCTSNITLKKFLKLLLEVYFYRIIFYLIFSISQYQHFSLTALAKVLFPVSNVSNGFTSCYLLFFLFIPFLNILIQNITEKQHALLIALCAFVYVILGTIPQMLVTMNYVSWFIVLYFMASYIRLYPKKYFDDTKITGWMTMLLVFVSMLSVVAMLWLGKLPYSLVADSNKLLAVLTGVFSFCFFKNIQIRNSKFINTVAASTFGVLLIHANSDTMRQWLWKDTLNNVGMYNSSLLYIHAFASVVGIFVVCTIIDVIRRKLFETPFFRWFDKKN
ncbi:MAG: acyltransferase family protein [Synergistaceae bacterium]|nr:acyltransferase family protein [Synergistaceae bacterium]